MIDRSRCTTGIDLLDLDMNGGIPVGSIVLICGPSGVGKTTFGMQFLAKGVKKGEKGIFFTANETPQKLKNFQSSFGFYDDTFVKNGDLVIVDIWSISDKLGLNPEQYSYEEANILFEVIRDIVKEIGAKRLVIDSITSLCHRLKTREMIRDFIFKLGSSLTVLNCTTFLISEVSPGVFQFSQHEVEEFIADGIIFLSDLKRGNDMIRTLQIVKMRGTSHSRKRYMVNISAKDGIDIAPLFKLSS